MKIKGKRNDFTVSFDEILLILEKEEASTLLGVVRMYSSVQQSCFTRRENDFIETFKENLNSILVHQSIPEMHCGENTKEMHCDFCENSIALDKILSRFTNKDIEQSLVRLGREDFNIKN